MTPRRILHIISIWVVVLPLIAGIINYKGLNRDSKWIFFLTVVAVPPQILTYFFVSETKWLNLSYNLYTPIEFVLLYSLFQKKYELSINRRLLQVSGLLYVATSSYLVIINGMVDHFIQFWVCANNLLYIFWIMTFLKEQYNSDSFVISKRNPFAWYILALIIYAPCTLVLFCLYYYIRDPHRTELLNLWLIQIICNILLYLLFAIGLFISKKDDIRGYQKNK